MVACKNSNQNCWPFLCGGQIFLLSFHSLSAIILLHCILWSKKYHKEIGETELIISFSFVPRKNWYFCTKLDFAKITSHDFAETWSKGWETDTITLILRTVSYYLLNVVSIFSQYIDDKKNTFLTVLRYFQT